MIRNLSIAVIFSSFFCFFCFGFAEAQRSQSNDGTVLVEIDGTRITAADFSQKKPGAFFQSQIALYDAQRKALDAFVDEYLVERQAKKENVTVAELLKRHVESAIEKDPSEEVLKVYYEGVDSNEPFETAKDKIREYIRQRRIAKAKAAYLQSLRSEAKIAFRLEPPRAKISLKNTPIRGVTGAPVTVVEFADFECPYCQVVHPHLAKLRGDFGDKLALAFKDLPLPNHQNAQKAAEAAHCSGAQGKYWEYHDVLFEKKQSDVAKLKEYARGLNLNGEAFDKCLDSGAQAARVKADLAEAQEMAIPGTPAFFVNGRFISAAASYEVLRNAIQEELDKTSAPRAGLLKK